VGITPIAKNNILVYALLKVIDKRHEFLSLLVSFVVFVVPSQGLCTLADIFLNVPVPQQFMI